MPRWKRGCRRGKGPEHFDPGPLSREIAAWKRDYPEIQIATFNYDELLERALEDAGVSAEARENNDPERERVAAVRHLHGRLTGKPASDAVILTERDYATWPQGSWQDAFMRDALEGVCVFLGLSFTDQNLLRWIYGAPSSGHVAVLARQSTPPSELLDLHERTGGHPARDQRASVGPGGASADAGHGRSSTIDMLRFRL